MGRRGWAVSVAVAATLVLWAGARAEEAPGRGPWVPSWTVAYGGFGKLDGLDAAVADTGWAVDAQQVLSGGTNLRQTAFVHHEGTVWRVTEVAEGVSLNAISLTGPDSGFAVGAGGAIYHLAAGWWERASSGVREDLTDVSLADPANGWAGGNSGVLLRWDGRGWRRYSLPVELSVAPITAVAALADGTAWATSLGGQVLRFSGDAWQVVDTPALKRPVDMAFADAGHGMVVGRGALEWKDGAWHSAGDSALSYRSVTWAGADAYAVVNDRLRRYHDGAWTVVTFVPGAIDLSSLTWERVSSAPGGAYAVAGDGTLAWIADGSASYVWPVSRYLEAVDMATPAMGWAGGQTLTGGFVGAAAEQWSRSQALEPGLTVWDLDLVSERDGWAVGSDPDAPGSVRLWRWDGTTWSEWPVDKTWELARVQMLAADDGWVSGVNVIGRWRGAGWQALSGAPPDAAGPLSILRGGDDPEGWFGAFGRIYHMQGDTWTESGLSDSGQVLALAVPAADSGWAITGNSLLHYDGQTWRNAGVSVPEGTTFVDLSAAAVDDVWVLLAPNGLLHWNGRLWERHDLAPFGRTVSFARLRAIQLPAPAKTTDVWLVGSPPTIARYRVTEPVTQLALPYTER